MTTYTKRPFTALQEGDVFKRSLGGVEYTIDFDGLAEKEYTSETGTKWQATRKHKMWQADVYTPNTQEWFERDLATLTLAEKRSDIGGVAVNDTGSVNVVFQWKILSTDTKTHVIAVPVSKEAYQAFLNGQRSDGGFYVNGLGQMVRIPDDEPETTNEPEPEPDSQWGHYYNELENSLAICNAELTNSEDERLCFAEQAFDTDALIALCASVWKRIGYDHTKGVCTALGGEIEASQGKVSVVEPSEFEETRSPVEDLKEWLTEIEQQLVSSTHNN